VWQPVRAAGVRPGACTHAQRPRPDAPAAAPARRVSWQALDAQRRRLPHWGRGKRRRAHPARKEPATRRPVRWPTSCRCGKRASGDRTGPDADGCHQAEATGTGRKACHAGAPEYQPATPRGRPVPEPVWRAARTRRACEPVAVFVVAAVDAQRRGCHRRVSPRKARTQAARRACESASRPTGRRRTRRPERGGCGSALVAPPGLGGAGTPPRTHRRLHARRCVEPPESQP